MTASLMPADEFWRIIDLAAVTGYENDVYTKALGRLLRELPLDDIIAFEMIFRRFLNQAYSWDLWGAAYVIHAGCPDDCFEYFRRWLVARGRDVYEAALTDPESLVQVDEEAGDQVVWEFEEVYYVAHEVFREKGGKGDVRQYSEPEAGFGGPDPVGEPFPEDDDEHLALRYPKLWRRFVNRPQL